MANDSNIAKFQDMFDIIEPENTSLQRKIKQYLIEGKNIKSGVGILK